MGYDFVLNGKAHGDTASILLDSGMHPGVYRPYVSEKDRQTYISLPRLDRKGRFVFNDEGKVVHDAIPTVNAKGILMRREWEAIDQTVRDAATPTLKFWKLLRGISTYRIPQGLGKTTLLRYMSGDIAPAQINMDPIVTADKDMPEMDSSQIPLPIIQKDCWLKFRELEVSRNSREPLNTQFVRMATRKVSEEIEKLAVGIGLGFVYQGHTLYGVKNFPKRISMTLTDPESDDWTAKILIDEIIQMKKASRDAGYNGPWILLMGAEWEAVMEADYSALKGDNTLMDRIKKLTNISRVETMDYLQGWDIILLQDDGDTARAVVAMDPTVIQWNDNPFRLRMKVMACCVADFGADFYDGCGIVHATVEDS